MTSPTAIEGAERLDTWAIVEMFGHKRLAGKVSEHVIGSEALIRVDVPETQLDEDARSQAFTKLVGPKAIYCITPCSEEVARGAAQRFVRYDPPIPLEFQPRLPAGTTVDAQVDDGSGDEDDFGGVGDDDDEEVAAENLIE